MDTPYNRRIASINDAIMERSARHAPANFVGRGYGSDSGINTQYNDVMRGAANHPRALSQAEKEYRMEGSAASFGGSWMDDIGQAFRYTPLGMASDAISGRDTVFSGRGGAGYGGAGYGGAGYGGNAAAMVGTTMPFREVPYAGVIDHARSGAGKPKFPLETKVQVGNSDGSGRSNMTDMRYRAPPPQVEAAWYENMDDFTSGRNRMKDSKKVGRMTKDPEMLASGGRDFTAEELAFVKDLLGKSGAGFYGGEWYNDWGDFTEAIKDAYDTVKGVWEDYIKPVLDVVGTPLKDALLSSGNPYGEAGAGVLELLGYGYGGAGSDGNGMIGCGDGVGGMYGAPSGMSGGMYGVSSGRSGGRMVKGSAEAKAYMASIRAKRGSKGGLGGGEGVFADAKPIAANSLGFSPKLEVEQLNAATGSTSYGDMPTSNPVGSGIGGKKRKIVPKNSRGVASAPTKMGEGLVGGITAGEAFQQAKDMGSAAVENIIRPFVLEVAGLIVQGAAAVGAVSATVMAAARRLRQAYNREDVQTILRFVMNNWQLFIRFMPVQYQVLAWLSGLVKAYFSLPPSSQSQPYEGRQRVINPDDSDDDAGDVVHIGREGEGRKGGKNWWDGLVDKADFEDDRQPVSAVVDRFTTDAGNDKFNFKGGKKKISRKTNMKEREGLLVSGDNSMGTTMASRGRTKKAQKASGAVVEAKNDIWEGKQFDNLTGRSGMANPSLVLEGGSMSGGAHALTQTNNLHAVYGGAMSKMKSEYSGKGGGKMASPYNAFVSKTMKEKGMKLAEAVKYIKANGLYKK